MDAPIDRNALAERTRALLTDPDRIRTAELNGKRFRFPIPSLRFYYPPFEWFWDTCRQAEALAAIRELALAKESIESILLAQRENGFLPHVIFWDLAKVKPWRLWDLSYQETTGRLDFLPFIKKPRTTELIQPPVIAQAVLRIIQDEPDRAFLERVVPKLNRYYDYLLTVRDADRDHLIANIHRFETGFDWSPAYDPADGFRGVPRSGFSVLAHGWGSRLANLWRFNYAIEKVLARGSFHVEDVAVNSILSLNLRALASLNARIGDHDAAARFDAKGVAVRDALITKCYDRQRGAFFNLTGRDEKRFPVLTIHSLFPLILPDLPSDIVDTLVERHLTNPDEFWLPYPVPSVARNDPAFRKPIKPFPFLNFRFTWRDGTWVNTNHFLVHGLRRHRRNDIADAIAEKTRELVAESGFYEYFDPETGEGHGAPDLGWSALVVDM